MNKKYFIKHLFIGFLFLITAIVAFYIDDELFYQDFYLVVFMILSTALYPLSRYLTTTIACKLTGPEFWKKGIFTKGDVSGITALFMFFCFAFAIPLSSCYLLYTACKKG